MAKTKYIETPEKLWQLFENYRTLTKNNPRYKTVFVGKDGMKDKEDLERPLTLEGFENHCFENNEINDLGDYFSNKDERYKEYTTICSRIRAVIRQDQIEGGMVGQYNPSITQRLNGLTEKTSNENTNINRNITIESVQSTVPISNSESEVKLD